MVHGRLPRLRFEQPGSTFYCAQHRYRPLDMSPHPTSDRRKLLRTIRLDPSDSFVFERAAEPGEWAVPGGFEFVDDPLEYSGRAKQAFRSGFLGLTSFGWSTLVVVVEATPDEWQQAVDALARHLVERHGAPSLAEARAAAADEIAYAHGLADHPEQTLVALHRTVDADRNVREQFRTLHTAKAREEARMPCSAGAFAIIEEAEAAGAAAQPDAAADAQGSAGNANANSTASANTDEVDLVALMRGGRS
jgi:hypothetical protein